jgi:hypothetical protein
VIVNILGVAGCTAALVAIVLDAVARRRLRRAEDIQRRVNQ